MRYWAGDYDVTEQFEWAPADQCLVNKTRWVWPGGRQRAGYRLRVFTPAQLERMLARAGFEPLRWFGDFDGEAFDPYNSSRMIVIARKSATP
jgi:hypothetical protein